LTSLKETNIIAPKQINITFALIIFDF